MIRTLILSLATGALLTCCTTGSSESSSAKQSPVTEKSAKKMARTAQTLDQYEAVAETYRQLHYEYLQKADAEITTLIWREQCTVSICAKYPTPVDSARNLYEYYKYKATEMNDLSSRYSNTTVPAQSHY